MRRRFLIGAALLAALSVPPAAGAADDGPWHTVPSASALDRERMFPSSVFFSLGFHFFPAARLRTGLTPTAHDARHTRDDFVRTLFEAYRPQYLAGTSFELGYGYRFHRYFDLQVEGAFVTQRTERKVNVYKIPATVRYQYVGGFVLLLAQARFPLSKVDFVVGLGPQLSLAHMTFYIRGSTVENGKHDSSYRVTEDDPLLVGVGGAVEGGLEYRPRDNWGILVEYRYAMVPSRFRGHAFDQGGHYGLLANFFHF